jgi:hypothetical protein
VFIVSGTVDKRVDAGINAFPFIEAVGPEHLRGRFASMPAVATKEEEVGEKFLNFAALEPLQWLVAGGDTEFVQ